MCPGFSTGLALPRRALRALAAASGVSHSLLLYHFGSRAACSAPCTRRADQRERAYLETFRDESGDPYDTMRGVWRHLTELRMGPLYRVGFALRARGAAGAEPGAEDERAPWIEALLPLVRAVGVPEERARAEVFLWLATCRGLLWELTTGADPMVVGAAAEAFFAHCAGGGSR